jgi:hypothetical protein
VGVQGGMCPHVARHPLSVLLVLLANEVGRTSRIAKGLSHLVLLDSFSHGRPRRHLEHRPHCIRQQARCATWYFSTTAASLAGDWAANDVSGLSLAPQRATVLISTNNHSTG